MNAKIKIVFISVALIYCYLFIPLSNWYVNAQNETNNANDLSSLQRKKLELEIQDLEDERTTWNKATEILPFLTTFIAVAGLLFTIYKTQIERKQELAARDEDHIRDDMNQLLTLDPDEETPTGMITFLFDDLNRLVERNPDRRKAISVALFTFIKEDCNFDRLRHIHLDIASIELWKDYKEYLVENPKEHGFIMYKYFQSLRQLHDEDKKYFESIQRKESGFEVEAFTDEMRYLRFLALIIAYSLHLEILNPQAKERAIERFQRAMNNQSLTEQLFPS